jgi:hypothetical protein
MDIVIPTFGRVGKQTTFDNLPDKWKQRVDLIVRPCELEAHNKQDPKRRLHVLPEGVERIADVRHWLVHKAQYFKSDQLVMLDDDMVFAARRTDEPNKFRNMVDQDFDDMFGDLAAQLLEYAHAGISHREGANRNTDEYAECTRQMRVLGYQKKIMRSLNITGRTKVMEDFDVTLQLLRLGMPNRLCNMWVHNQGGSAVIGGCSSFRTPEVQAEAAHELHRLHPRYVKVVEKETKTSWGGGTRTDVTIYWKKAIKDGLRNNPE